MQRVELRRHDLNRIVARHRNHDIRVVGQRPVASLAQLIEILRNFRNLAAGPVERRLHAGNLVGLPGSSRIQKTRPYLVSERIRSFLCLFDGGKAHLIRLDLVCENRTRSNERLNGAISNFVPLGADTLEAEPSRIELVTQRLVFDRLGDVRDCGDGGALIWPLIQDYSYMSLTESGAGSCSHAF